MGFLPEIASLMIGGELGPLIATVMLKWLEFVSYTLSIYTVPKKLTYPTFEKEKSSSKATFDGICDRSLEGT